MAAWDDVIDFDNVGEWPMELSGWLKLLQSPADEEQRSQIVQLVRKCLQEARIRTYHCARLLPSEVESIKVNGLLPASLDLARDKREAARNAGQPLPFWARGSLWQDMVLPSETGPRCRHCRSATAFLGWKRVADRVSRRCGFGCKAPHHRIQLSCRRVEVRFWQRLVCTRDKDHQSISCPIRRCGTSGYSI